MKIQRGSNVIRYVKRVIKESFLLLIRVVPPKSFGPLWTKRLFLFHFYKMVKDVLEIINQ